MYCKNCGKEIEEVNFCPYCGAEQTSTRSTQTEQTNQGYEPINQQNYQQQSYQGQNYNSDDESSIGFAVLSFFIPIVGLVLYLVWKNEYPKKAKSCLNGLIVGVVLYVVFVCCMVAGVVGIASSEPSFYYDTIIRTVLNG